MSNAQNCILRGKCSLAGTERCVKQCQHFVALHGFSGKGGRVGEVLPLEYSKFTAQDNPMRPDNARIFRLVDQYVSTFDRMFIAEPEGVQDMIKNAYFWSEEPGTGKTATACAIANDFMATEYTGRLLRGQRPTDYPVYFLDMVEFQTLYNQFNREGVAREMKEAASRKYYLMMNNAKNAQLLIMDDIGARSATEMFRTDLHDVINHRYKRKKPTIWTSNKPIFELTDIFDKKLMDRVRDLTVEIEFGGSSKRGAKR